MTNKVTHVISDAIGAATKTVTGYVQAAPRIISGLRERHVDLMKDRAAYRAQLATAVAAVVALIEIPHTWAMLVLAVVAVYIATFTPNEDGGWFRSSLDGPDDSYDRW